MKLQFNLAEVLMLADEGLKVMRERSPELEAWPEVGRNFEKILELLARTEPVRASDVAVTLDVMDFLED